MLYYQRVIVNTLLFGSLHTFFVLLSTVLLIIVVALGLHVQIQDTQHSIIELCYLTCQIKNLFLFDVYLF